MAAVLCQSCGSLTKGLCRLPCQMTQACCEGLSECCAKSGRWSKRCCTFMACGTPAFCCHVTTVLVLNVPTLVLEGLDLALQVIPNNNGNGLECPGSLWLLVCSVFCVCHIVAAFYMAYTVQPTSSTSSRSSSSSNHNNKSQFQRLVHLLCYDLGMAAYLLIVIGFVAWMGLGTVQILNGEFDGDADANNMNENATACPNDDMFLYLQLALGFGWVFVLCGGAGFFMSVCCLSIS